MDNKHYQADAVDSAPELSTLGSEGYPTNGSPSLGIPATQPGAAWFHGVASELHNAIAAFDVTPDAASCDQLGSAIIDHRKNYGVFAYSSGISYGLGAVVLYSGKLYQSLAANNSTAPTNTSKWSQVTTLSDVTNAFAKKDMSNVSSTGTANLFKQITNYGTSEQIISMHNNVFRGDNLLNGHFASISAIISTVAAGNFSDIYVGDYFPATYTVDGSSITSNFRVAGINFFTAANGSWGSSGKPHLVIVPDSTITSYMNSTNTSAGGYVGSYMYTTTLPKLYTALAGSSGTPFYGHVISKYEQLTNAVDTTHAPRGCSTWLGVATSWSVYANQTLTLMSEPELYGHSTWGSSGGDEEHAACQLPLFRVNPNYITVNGTQNTWLRGVTNSAGFCLAAAFLSAACSGASNVFAVRPRFLIG